ncbi:MAG TPA: hypothetical protein VF554_15545 [Thermoanaerobaculia bacterium]
MSPSARPAPEAFRRGLSAVVANPGLILAPLALSLAVLASIAAPALLLFLKVAGSFRGFGSSGSPPRDPAAFVEPLRNLLEGLQVSPLALLLGLLGLLLALLLLTALAAFLRAGVTGCLLAIDARAAEDAPLAAFRHPVLSAVFWSSARKNYGRFFALVNLYGLALSCVMLLLLLPLGLAVFAGTSGHEGHGGLIALAFVLFLLVLPLALGASIAIRVLYLVACRLAASEDVDALEAVARAVSRSRASLKQAVLLYLLTLAAGFVSGFAFLVPRIALSLVGGHSFVLFAVGTGAIVLAQILVGFAYDLAVSGAFVSLWAASPEPEVFGETGG